MSSLKELVDLCGEAHEKLEIAKRDYEAIRDKVKAAAVYPAGKNTVHMEGGHWNIIVSRKESVKYFQDKLDALRRDIGDEEFFKVFKWTFEPVDKKTLDGAVNFSPHKDRIKETFLRSEASPTFVFKEQESC
jgi:hypothetical protein